MSRFSCRKYCADRSHCDAELRKHSAVMVLVCRSVVRRIVDAPVRAASVISVLLLGTGAAFASELGDCGHPVPARSIRDCSLLIERGDASREKIGELRLLRGVAYTIRGDADQAMADLDEAIHIAPSPAAFVARGDAYRRKGQVDRAKAEYDQAIRINPDHIEAHLARGEGELDQRPEWLHKLNHLGFEAVMAALLRRVPVSRMDEHKHQIERTFTQLDEVIQRNPSDGTAYVKRAEALLRLGERQYDRAMADFDLAIAVNPYNVSAYTRRALVYRDRGEHDRAIADFGEAIRLRPDGATAYLNRGILHNLKGDYERTIADLDQALRLEPKLGQAHYYRGLALEKTGKRDKAITDYRKVLEFGHSPLVNPSRALAEAGLKRLGVTDNEMRAWSIEATITRYDRAIQENPNDAVARGMRCLFQMSKGEHDKAIADCDEAVRLSPNSPAPYGYRGLAHLGKRDYDRAIADFDESIRLDSRGSPSYADRGRAYLAKGDYKRAITDFDQAIQLTPKHVTAYADRGLAHERNDERDKAIADYRKALELHSHNPKAPPFAPSMEGLRRLGVAP
jgi:tetratricopeptide (TPR) repeat protein